MPTSGASRKRSISTRYSPVEAIWRLIEFTFDYDETHPDFIRLVSTENMHHASHIAQSAVIKDINRGVISMLQRVLDRGKQDGVFCQNVDPVDVHLMISSFCFFRVSNRYTFGALFGCDFSDPDTRTAHKRMLAKAVLNALTDNRGQDGLNIDSRAA